MQRQGVWTVLDTPEDAASSLYILGAHRKGNKIARLYTKVLEQQEGRLLSLSPSELFDCDENCIGITTPHGRITLDGYAAIDILTHNRGMSFFHEARHQMFNARRRTGLGSIFDHLFMVGAQASRDLDGNEISKVPRDISEGYAFSMTLEEIYTHTYDLSYYVREMKKQDWSPGFWAKQAFIEKADILWKISRNVQEITANVLADFPSPIKNATIKARDDYGNRSIIVADSYGREIDVHIGQGEAPEADELAGFLGTHLEEINGFAASVLARKPIIDGILAEGNESGGFHGLAKEMLLLRRLMQGQLHD